MKEQQGEKQDCVQTEHQPLLSSLADEKLRENCGLPFGFLYGLEIASVVTTTVLGILVNSLLGKYLYTCHSSEIKGFWST